MRSWRSAEPSVDHPARGSPTLADECGYRRGTRQCEGSVGIASRFRPPAMRRRVRSAWGSAASAVLQARGPRSQRRPLTCTPTSPSRSHGGTTPLHRPRISPRGLSKSRRVAESFPMPASLLAPSVRPTIWMYLKPAVLPPGSADRCPRIIRARVVDRDVVRRIRKLVARSERLSHQACGLSR